MRLIAISFVACLLCAPALAAAKKQTALECCGKFGGRWNPLTTPGICYGLGQATSIAYRQCAGR
jgi:hypothetical protein